MNKLGVLLATIFFVFGICALSANGHDHPKPSSAIEFGISKHAGLHYVNGGFNKYQVVKVEKGVAGFKNLQVEVDINSLWTWQADTKRSDDPNRTADLLSDDWFDVAKYPKAFAHFNFLPLNNAKKVPVSLTIKGRTKVLFGSVKSGYFSLRIKLSDFNIDNSWKKIFAGKYADLKVKLIRNI